MTCFLFSGTGIPQEKDVLLIDKSFRPFSNSCILSFSFAILPSLNSLSIGCVQVLQVSFFSKNSNVFLWFNKLVSIFASSFASWFAFWSCLGLSSSSTFVVIIFSFKFCNCWLYCLLYVSFCSNCSLLSVISVLSLFCICSHWKNV